jgi:hypothetical protein
VFGHALEDGPATSLRSALWLREDAISKRSESSRTSDESFLEGTDGLIMVCSLPAFIPDLIHIKVEKTQGKSKKQNNDLKWILFLVSRYNEIVGSGLHPKNRV